jgi:hypothetical protein
MSVELPGKGRETSAFLHRYFVVVLFVSNRNHIVSRYFNEIGMPTSAPRGLAFITLQHPITTTSANQLRAAILSFVTVMVGLQFVLKALRE